MSKQTRREFLRRVGSVAGSVAASSLFTGCATVTPEAEPKRRKPNIIFVLADDLGYGDLRCYGQKEIQTPNLDRMADEGMLFRQHYAGSTVCAPSRCVLMTGQHTGHCTVRSNSPGLMKRDDKTVAEILKYAGYTTGVIGKWGVGHPPPGDPARNGFDYFFGYLSMVHAHNYYPEFLWRNERKVKLRNIVEYTKSGYAKGVGGVSTNKLDYSHDLLTEAALAFVDRNRDKPFFLYLPYTIPHANNQAGHEGMEVPDYGIYKNKDWPEPEKGKAAMITRMDRDVGKLLGKLDELGIAEDTLVMFSSDNGPHKEGGADPSFLNSSGPLRGIKRDLYEGGIRVPLVARWRGRIMPGSVSDHVSAFWDFLPTCVELADLMLPEGIDGISMVPTLMGHPERQRKHEFLYWEFHERGGKQAVRMGDFKAVRLNVRKDPDGPLELYNLKNDMGEEHNIAAEHPDLIAKIEAYLKTARTDSLKWPIGRKPKN
jgi:arylsulfatase A-like enzyme